jgi:ribosomal protein S18 acetylase RimI-like enzyme
MEPKYRSGTANDKEQLQALGLVAYGPFRKVLTEENWNKLHQFLANPQTFSHLMQTSTCFICEINNELVGMSFLVSKGHPTDMFKAEWSYIRMVGVNPAFGGNGIGKKLTQMCIDYAKETNEEYIALLTSEFMNSARHIYENLGFEQLRELDIRYGKRCWIYFMDLKNKL